MTQPLPGAQTVNVENELDIRGLFRALWAGKIWIAGMAVLFALIVLVYAFFARQEWSATAITDRPTVNMLGGYYSQQQFLRNLDIKANLVPVDQPSAMDQAYKEFIMQQGSWDTRRDFWLQTDYYKQRQSGNARADAALLDDLINNIQFMPGDPVKNVNDSVKLTAETAPDANNLLRQYVAFAAGGNSILSPDNPWNLAGQSVGQFAFGSEGPLGKLLGARDALTMPDGAQAFNMAFPIHASKVGGWGWRTVMTISGLAMTMLGSFAVWSFWFRRPRPAKRPEKKAALASA